METVGNTARSLNNEGIQYISQGRYGEALGVISRGLTLVKQILSAGEDERESSSIESDTSDNPACFIFQINKEVSSIADCQDAMRGQKTYVFCNPIFLPTDRTRKTTSFKYYISLSFILVLNLALTHHLIALEAGEVCPKNLQKALFLYELAYTIHMSEDIDVSVLHTMVIYNNLGQIHTMLGHEDKAQYCFENLLTTIMYLNECRDKEADDNAMDGFCMDSFVGNVVWLILTPSSAPAPAA